MPQIKMPKSNTQDETVSLRFSGALVCVGANGSGKSRLGAWIEENGGTQIVSRISAQRVLTVQDPQPENFPQAEAKLQKQKISVESPASDYQLLVNCLFKNWQDRNNAHVIKAQKSRKRSRALPELEEAVLEKIQHNWQMIFPHRILNFDQSKLEVKNQKESYPANQMSDGEKVALYLMGKILLAPKRAILVIDEPELHLHRALLKKFWHNVMVLRKDCIFVFITHDLDFSAFVSGDTIIWLRDYVKTRENKILWTWEQIKKSPYDTLPEELKLEVLGSRDPTLLVEGKMGGGDHILYKAVYGQKFNIRPVGGAEEVIRYVKALNEVVNRHTHGLNVIGLIDRDCRTSKELKQLSASRVRTMSVRNREALLCIPTIFEMVTGKSQSEIEASIMRYLNDNKEAICVEHICVKIRRKKFPFLKNTDRATLEEKAGDWFLSELRTFDQLARKIDKVIAEKNIKKALSFCDKNLFGLLTNEAGMSKESFEKKFIELLKDEEQQDILSGHLKTSLPNL